MRAVSERKDDAFWEYLPRNAAVLQIEWQPVTAVDQQLARIPQRHADTAAPDAAAGRACGFALKMQTCDSRCGFP